MTINELERRFQNVQALLSAEEQQAIQQGIDKFKSGWYVHAAQYFFLGTFYAPISPLFTALLWIIGAFPFLCFPVTTFMFGNLRFFILCAKNNSDNAYLCRDVYLAVYYTVFFTVLFPLWLLTDIIWFLSVIFVLPFLFLGLILLELVVLPCGLCYYRCQRLNESGVFALKWKVKLVSSRLYHHYNKQTITTTMFDMAVDVSLPRISLCRSIFRNPVAGIFNGIHWQTYSYGNIDSVEHLTAEEVQMYEVLKQMNP